MEEFYYEETHSKHVFFKCMLYLFIVGACIGIFLFYKKENTIKLKKITIEVGSKLSSDIEDYLISGLKNKDKYKLYLNDVDTNRAGEYIYKIKYNKHIKKGTIIVADTKKPIVKLDSITIGVDEEFNTNLLLESCEDYSLPCTITFNNEDDLDLLKKAGKYNIEFKISDSEGNSTLKKTTINVSETETLSSKMTNDLEYYTNSENDDKIEHVFFKKLDKAIYEDTMEYEGMIQEISAIDFSKYVNDEIYATKLITAYNKYGYVIGIQVEITFNNGEKLLIQDKVINNEEE